MSAKKLISCLDNLNIPYQLKSQTDDLVLIYLKVKAVPGSKTVGMKVENDFLKVNLRERPIEGAANKALRKVFMKSFGVGSQVELVSGDKSKLKEFAIVFEFKENKTVEFYIEKLKKALT